MLGGGDLSIVSFLVIRRFTGTTVSLVRVGRFKLSLSTGILNTIWGYNVQLILHRGNRTHKVLVLHLDICILIR